MCDCVTVVKQLVLVIACSGLSIVRMIVLLGGGLCS